MEFSLGNSDHFWETFWQSFRSRPADVASPPEHDKSADSARHLNKGASDPTRPAATAECAGFSSLRDTRRPASGPIWAFQATLLANFLGQFGPFRRCWSPFSRFCAPIWGHDPRSVKPRAPKNRNSTLGVPFRTKFHPRRFK